MNGIIDKTYGVHSERADAEFTHHIKQEQGYFQANVQNSGVSKGQKIWAGMGFKMAYGGILETGLHRAKDNRLSTPVKSNSKAKSKNKDAGVNFS